MTLNKHNFELAQARAGMTVSEIASKSGLSYSAVLNAAHRAKKPRPDTIGRIAKALGVKAEELAEETK